MWVSTFAGSSWAASTLLAAKSPAYQSKFGAAVAISADGALVAVGAPSSAGGGNYRGQAFAYTFAASAWTEDVLGSGASNFYKIGTAVAVAESGAAGAVAVVAAYDQSGSTGAVYVAARPSAGSWGALTQVAGGAASGDYFGSAVAISADGLTVLIGAQGQVRPAGSLAGRSTRKISSRYMYTPLNLPTAARRTHRTSPGRRTGTPAAPTR